MVANIELFLGKKNSGKSEFAERRTLDIRSELKPLYVATLPDIHRYNYIIRRHRERRQNDWEVYCVVDELSEILSARLLDRAVLVDGISVYIFRKLIASGDNSLQDVARALVESFGVIISHLQRECTYVGIVTTLTSFRQRRAQFLRDHIAEEVNLKICRLVADLSSHIWHFENRREESVACLQEVSELYGLTTT